jgi:integrase
MTALRGHLLLRGQVWYLQWRIGGKLHQKTTGKTDREEAEAERDRILHPFQLKNEVAALETLAGRITGRKTELAKIEARKPALTLDRAWKAFEGSPDRPDSGPSTLESYRGQWDRFRIWMGAYHPEASELRHVTREVAGQYASDLGKVMAGGTFNGHVRTLRLVFKTLADVAKLDGNPWGRIRTKRVVRHGRRELTVEELRRVCGSAEGDLRTLLAVGLYTGLRLGDCATLRWAEVDMVRRLVRRIPNKTARRNPEPVTVPVHPALHGILSELDRAGEHVLPDMATLYLRDKSALSKRIQAHFKACGIETRGKGRSPEVGFHSLRHSFVSLSREAGTALSVVEAIVGHSSPAMTRHYSHTSEAAAVEGVRALPDVLGTGTKALPAPANAPDLRERVRTLAETLTGRNWRAVRAEILAAVSGG